MFRRRLAQGILLLFVVSILSFSFAALTPGDYFDSLRLNPKVAPETLDAMRARYGLGDPLPVRYVRWLGSMARGELGFSVQYGSPVATLLLQRARNTLLLTVTATVIAWLIAVPGGIWVAASRSRGVQTFFSASTSTLLAIPDIMMTLLLLLFAVKTNFLPVAHMVSADFDRLGMLGQVVDLLHHLILPVTAIVLGTLPGLIRQVHASVKDTLATPFLQAARARGVPQKRLLYLHALRACANPLISLLGLSFASLLSLSLLVEYVLGWPGLGPLLVSSILNRDVDLVTATILLSTVLLVIGNLLADVLLLVVDPRTRSSSTRSPV